MFVYVAAGDGTAKIGAAHDPAARVRYFATCETHRGLTRLVRVWDRPHDAIDVEYTATRGFVPAKPTWGYEQFDVSPDVLITAVERAIAMVEVGQGLERPSSRIKRMGWKIGKVKSEFGITISHGGVQGYIRPKPPKAKT